MDYDDHINTLIRTRSLLNYLINASVNLNRVEPIDLMVSCSSQFVLSFVRFISRYGCSQFVPQEFAQGIIVLLIWAAHIITEV